MIDENRVIVSLGCALLQEPRRVGTRELLRVAGVTHVDARTIGFSLGPRPLKFRLSGYLWSRHI